MNNSFYLVMLRGSTDDVPILLTEDRKQAERVVDGNTDGLNEYAKWLVGDSPENEHISIYELKDGRVVEIDG